MAQSSSTHEASDKCGILKRKLSSSDDELENQPPLKIFSDKEEDLQNQPAQNVVIESSCSSDEDGSQYGASQPLRSVYTDDSPNNLHSPLGIHNCVLSPLENIARGDSTPHSNKRPSSSKLSCPMPPKRKCPLPGLTWAEPTEVWNSMCSSDVSSSLQKNPNMFDNHPNLQARMRAILLDWLNEVCEVYKLHRETFHLTVAYVDRYLSKVEDIHKGRLQLIGITCLFIAAKVEEVYPPKIGEFAYVTDGACTAEEILLEEKLILITLNWNLTPITINSWLNIYMQLASEGNNAKRRLLRESDIAANALRGYTFLFPQYSSLEFVICGQLVDLAVLHVDVNLFSYGTVAAAAMAHIFSKDLAVRVSGYSWECISACYRWMAPFVAILRAEGDVCVVRAADGEFVHRAGELERICPDLNIDESHCIQTHNISLDLFDKVIQLQTEQSTAQKDQTTDRTEPTTEQTETEATIANQTEVIFPPTPPQSNHKSPKTPITKTPSTRLISTDPDVRLQVEVE